MSRSLDRAASLAEAASCTLLESHEVYELGDQLTYHSLCLRTHVSFPSKDTTRGSIPSTVAVSLHLRPGQTPRRVEVTVNVD